MKDLATISYLLEKEKKPIYQTKFYKLLFYIDFYTYKHSDDSLTGAIYYKLPFGPVPLSIKTYIDIIAEKIGVGKDEIEQKDLFPDIEKYKAAISTKSDDGRLQISLIEGGSFANMLSEKEKELIDYVYLKVGHLGVQEIVDKSHSEEGYKATDMFQPIFYGFAESLSI